MSEKRFIDNGCESIEDSGFEDALTGKNYYVDYFYEIVDLLNSLNDENEQLKEENKRLKRNVKTFKEDRDSNFESAQYFREQLMKIPESIRSVWIE